MPLAGLLPGWENWSATRRNHALEHAAVTVLLERHGFARSLAGRSNSRGFHIFGDVSTEELKSAVDEALQRMQRGEGNLAVSPFCGTNIAVTGTLAALATLALVGGGGVRKRVSRLPNLMLGGIIATVAGQPIGRLAQKYLTTSPDVARLRVKSITRSGFGPFKGHWVETTQAA